MKSLAIALMICAGWPCTAGAQPKPFYPGCTTIECDAAMRKRDQEAAAQAAAKRAQQVNSEVQYINRVVPKAPQ